MNGQYDFIFTCFFVALALVGLAYIIVDDTIRFKKRRERMKKIAEQSDENPQDR